MIAKISFVIVASKHREKLLNLRKDPIYMKSKVWNYLNDYIMSFINIVTTSKSIPITNMRASIFK